MSGDENGANYAAWAFAHLCILGDGTGDASSRAGGFPRADSHRGCAAAFRNAGRQGRLVSPVRHFQAADARPVWQAEPSEDVSMQFSGSDRWEFRIDKLSRPSANLSPLPRQEMQAGATFKITPRFSVGGEVSVGADDLNAVSTWEDREVETGVRLKSAFKF
jgi:hypothetical protein